MNASTPLTFDDLLRLQQIGDPQISPDGSEIAYVVSAATLDVGQSAPTSCIWAVMTTGGEPRQVTRGPSSDDLPRWSPDGQKLAYRSDRVERGIGQIYIVTRGLGEGVALSRFDGGLTDFVWSPDGRSIAAVVVDPKPPHDEGADEILYEDDSRFARIWIIDVATGSTTQVTHGDEHIWELCWSPDGRFIAAVTSNTPHRWAWYRSSLSRINVSSGEVTELHVPERQIARPAWSPDGQWIAVTTSIWSDPGMTGGDVLLVSASGDEVRHLRASDARSHLTVHWESESRSLLTSALEHGGAAICQVTLDGSAETLWREERGLVSYGTTVSRDASVVAAVMSSWNEPPEVWVGRAGADVNWQCLTHHNDELSGRIPGRLETRHWNAPDGQEIQGLLLRPDGIPEGQAVPMVTMIHGGPTGTSAYTFSERGTTGWIPELLRRGVAVLLPNARGSAGWGLKFAEANQHDMGGADLQDVLAGVDDCVLSGLADPDRLGVCGWSYGGYLTAWAVTQTDRFKAAIAGASITNWVSFHGTSDIPAFDEFFYRADPYDLSGPYVGFSPIFEANRVTTPTLFLHGERDLICPVDQAKEMFRALRDRGVPTQCVIYPREGHPIRENLHRHDMLERGVEWLCRWMGVPAEDREITT